ncbi:uncharacterized protein BYT42DRAFT_183883 [Radiomyces spectabilis]|uniref:uncharacterized protein n=1 Tax=Radiomyces spectabilis TaxID=64574 RepID=UPI00221EDDC0|nr:uncharacterized protein BYT42DRAFT_183883 [Radiomyces spectabilis]KAI8391163.1 hypothetical protein BYT42DRAFT_183883 [Radiomyces spectabilis]
MNHQLVWTIIFVIAHNGQLAFGQAQHQENNVNVNASDTIKFGTGPFWGSVIAVICLVAVSGMVAGLTLGLLSLDETNLTILATAGTAKEKQHAMRILPIRRNCHLLLTALVLTNTVVNETLPIVLDSILGQGYIAVIASTVLIVIFSEILPQAVCSRHGLAVGAIFATPVRLVIWFWFIIAWPIAKCLDWLLGANHGSVYRLEEIRELIDMHGVVRGRGGQLHSGTVQLVHGSLELQNKTAGEIARSVDNFILVASNELITPSLCHKIMQHGCTRILIFERMDHASGRRICGSLSAKLLFSLHNPEEAITLSKMALEPVVNVFDNAAAVTLVSTFRDKPHQVIVVYATNECNKETLITMDKQADTVSSLDEKKADSISVSGSATTLHSLHTGDVIGVITCEDLLAQIL